MAADSSIPQRIRERLDDVTDTAALTAVELHLAATLRQGRCLILTGDPDAGKTFALWYAREMARNMPSPLNLRDGDIYTPLPWRSRFYHAAEVSDFVGVADDMWLLLLDDLGVEDLGRNSYNLSNWQLLIDKRYREALPTIITTNLDPEALRARYGERIYSRLREWATVVSLPTEGLRSTFNGTEVVHDGREV
jgi:DNA replication protein DnaC